MSIRPLLFVMILLLPSALEAQSLKQIFRTAVQAQLEGKYD